MREVRRSFRSTHEAQPARTNFMTTSLSGDPRRCKNALLVERCAMSRLGFPPSPVRQLSERTCGKIKGLRQSRAVGRGFSATQRAVPAMSLAIEWTP